MVKVCAGGTTIKGIDIYRGDMITDINLVKGFGIKYAFLKAFEYKVDDRFKSRWENMKTAGIIRGAYDFFHPSRDPLAQADAFLNIVGPLQKGDLPMVLDWESTDGVPSTSDKNAALSWLGRVQQISKITPIIYTAPYFADALKLDSRFKNYPLWIAHYGVKCPLVPAPWTNWQFWQGSESAHVPGIRDLCDLDLFNGSLDQLKALTVQ